MISFSCEFHPIAKNEGSRAQFIGVPQKKIQREKLLDLLLANVSKAANPGAPFFFFGVDWLNPQKQK